MISARVDMSIPPDPATAHRIAHYHLTFITGATFVGLQGCELRVRGSGRSDLRTKSRVVGSDLEAYVRTVSGPERCRSCIPPGAGPVVLADAVAG